jgi:hypothetical protein
MLARSSEGIAAQSKKSIDTATRGSLRADVSGRRLERRRQVDSDLDLVEIY